jgi:hypothetical protein
VLGEAETDVGRGVGDRRNPRQIGEESRDTTNFFTGPARVRVLCVRSASIRCCPRFRVGSCLVLCSSARHRWRPLASRSALGTPVGASFPSVVAVITDEGTAGPSALGLHAAMASEEQEVPTNGRNVVVACTRSGKHATERASAK